MSEPLTAPLMRQPLYSPSSPRPCRLPRSGLFTVRLGFDEQEAVTALNLGRGSIVLRTTHHAATAPVALCVLFTGIAAPSVAATVAGGTTHTLVIRTTDQTVWAWGANSDGQLGDNSTTQRKTPIQVSGLSGVVAVAAGAKHSLALTSAGVLWVWGDNQYGQIGNGNTTDQKLPVQVMTGVTQIAAGDNHSIALKADGTLWTWGSNTEGQIGDGGTTSPRTTPYSVTGLGAVSAIAGGGNHTLVVLTAGSMKAWGKNSNGQLGDGSTYARATNPVAVAVVANATNASGGNAFTFARRFDGTLYAWGLNGNGQLGFGDTTQRPTPTLLAAPTSVAALATGGYHTLALLADGSVSAWGRNDYGGVGDGSGTQRTSPVAVPGIASVVAVGAGQYHSIAVTSTGEVWTWGYNNSAQLGDGTTANRLSPIKVAEAGFNWKAATPTFNPSPNTYPGNQTVTIASATTGATLRYTTDGTDPTASSSLYSSVVSVTVSTVLKARAFKDGLADSNVAAGLYTLKAAIPGASPGGGTYTTPQTVTLTTATPGATIRYTTDGGNPTEASPAYAGPLAIGTSTTLKAASFKAGWTTSDLRTATYTMNFGTLPAPTFSPVPGTYLDSVAVTITATDGATIRYTTNGSTPTTSSTIYTGPLNLVQTTTLKAKAWRVDYTESAVSSGAYTVRVAAPLLSLVSGTYPPGTSVTLTMATAGASLRYTLDGSDPTENDTGIASGGSLVLGNYTLKVRSFKAGCDPSDVVSATYAVSGPLTPGMVSAGSDFSLAVLGDGTAWSWGSSLNGKLGTGMTSGVQAVPAPIEALTGVVAVAAATQHALALTAAGSVWSWGANGSGQLGIGTTSTSESTPRPVSSLSGIVAVAAGGSFSAALASDGTLWVWGENGEGQLGLGDTNDRLVPTQALAGVAQMALGGAHVVALKSDGSVWTWGRNSTGQLGDGTTSPRNTPAQVTGLAGASHVAAGVSWSMATASGNGYGWGANGNGQLGNGTTTNRTSPTAVPALAGADRLDGGNDHSLGRITDGTLLSWGYNISGQLGDGTLSHHFVPAPVLGISDVVSFAAGESYSLALAGDGSIWAWGWNYSSRLGDGTSENRPSPVKIRDGGAWKVGTPVFNPGGGSHTEVKTVTVTEATAGATIRYTTNGADPTPSDPVIAAGGTVAVGQSLTLKAKAWKGGMADSNVAAANYALTVATPTMSTWGTFYTPQTVAISCSVDGATIRFTTNGLDPTPADPVIASGGTIAVDTTQTVKAKAWKAGWNDSAVATSNYTMVVGAPSLAPGGGSYSAGQAVAVSTVTPGAELHYTTTSLEPTLSDPIVPAGGSVVLTGSVTLKVKGWRTGWTASTTTTATYFVNEGTVAAPVLSPPPGSYAAGQAVTIGCATPGALVRYTLDGTPPGLASPAYAGPIPVTSSITLSARAFKTGWSASPVTSGSYLIASTAAAPPVISPDSGTLASGRPVRITSAESGVTIRYTTSGLDPVETDPEVPSGGSVLLGQSARLKARAWKEGFLPSPVSVSDFRLVGSVSAGSDYTIVLKSDGTLVAWGGNANGQLGDGTTTTRRVPGPVPGIGDVVAVAAGRSHNLVLKSDGSVWSWGWNWQGQLGDGTSGTDRTSPVRVVTAGGPLADVVAVAAGSAFSMALRQDGTVWTWGDGVHGQLGDGSTQDHLRATQVPGLSGITAIAAGDSHALALETGGGTQGSVWTWGWNADGQIGDGTTTSRLTPARVLEGAMAVAAGFSHSLAVMPDGTVKGAGDNAEWTLGDGTNVTPRTTFGDAFLGVEGIEKMDASDRHTLALTTAGEIWACGDNEYGWIGDGSNVDKPSPVRVVLIDDAVDLAAGHSSPSHSVALTADGRVWTWGSNASGRLGTGGGQNDNLYRPQVLADLTASDQSWPQGDPDGDGLVTEEEIRAGTDPFNPDTNGDGVSDLVAIRSGISATNPDMDGDGLANAAERAQGTDPLRADTDADGILDGSDCFPLDAARTTCPVPIPGDVTPPQINLTEPASAVLVSSVP
jgi:alpha-tubulin suppressor-like RCC1 family protein